METQGRPMLLGVGINLRFHIPHFTIGCPSSRRIQGAEHQPGGARQSKIFKDQSKFPFENYRLLCILTCIVTCRLVIK